MAFEGTVINGNVILDQPNSLPDGTRVEVVAKQPTESGKATVGQRLMWLVGAIPDLPPDFAKEHDHYIHGTPRRQE